MPIIFFKLPSPHPINVEVFAEIKFHGLDKPGGFDFKPRGAAELAARDLFFERFDVGLLFEKKFVTRVMTPVLFRPMTVMVQIVSWQN
jgi:hypothetical protein